MFFLSLTWRDFPKFIMEGFKQPIELPHGTEPRLEKYLLPNLYWKGEAALFVKWSTASAV